MKIIQRKFTILDPLDRWIFTPLARSAAWMSALGLLAAAPGASAQLLSTTTHQGGDEIVTFTGGSGTWTPPSGVTTVEVLVVAGGGGGGHNGGGGGGAGGLLHSSAFDVSGGDQAVTIGGGGTGSTSGAAAGTAGSDSVFGSLTAVGGGGGASRDGGGAAGTGGSGGGGGGGGAPQSTAGAATSGQGNHGGSSSDLGATSAGGGGGGAGGAGSNATSQRGANGGTGLPYSLSGLVTYYAGGGGGGKTVNGLTGSGGLGGGGNGAYGTVNNGAANTGGGGGGGSGGSPSGFGGSGGSGVVIVRYQLGTPANTFSWINSASSAWSPAANWDDGLTYMVPAGEADYTLNFNTAGTYTATNDLASGFLLNQLNFGGPTLTLLGNSLAFTGTLPQINQNSSAAVTVGNNLVLDADTTFGGSGTGTVTLAGTISGLGGLTKTGPGALALTGDIAYTGATVISGGTLQFAKPAIGSASYATANSFLFSPASGNLLAGLSPSANTNTAGGAEGSAAVAVLTDANNPPANMSNYLADGYTISNSAVLTYTLPAGAALGYDVSKINIYAGWGDSGRENISITSISYSTIEAPATFITIPNSSVNYEGNTASALAALTASGGVLGSHVYAVRFSFGGQENGYVGYRELEVIGTPSQVPVASAISLAAGSILDVSNIPTYTLSPGASLAASGTGTTVGTNAAAITGALGGSVDLGLRPLALSFTPASFSGDTTHPALVVTQGTLTVNGPITVHVSGSTPLGTGTYRLVWQTSGNITGTPTFASATGAGLETGLSALVQVSGSRLNLVVASNIVTPTITVTRHDGTTDSTTYGDSVSFDVAVTPNTTPPTGLVTLKDGDTTLGTYPLVSGDAGTCTITPSVTGLTAGPHANIVALYAGDSNFSSGVSAALSSQIVAPKVLTIADAASANKIEDGTTSTTLSGTLTGVISGDTVTVTLSAVFASATAGVQSVISTSTLGGVSQANYTLTQPTTVTAEILAAGTWTGNGNGHWAQNGDTSNWLGGLIAGNWQSATFDGNTVNGNVVLDWYKGTNWINLNSGLTTDIIFSNGLTDSLVQNSDGGMNIATDSKDLTMNNGQYPLFAGVTWNIGAGRTLTVNSNINNGGGITMNGPGTAVLTNANSYAGQTFINSGTLVAKNGRALGAGGFNGGTMTHLSDGATLALQGGISMDEHMHIAGAGVGGLGAIRSISGNNAMTTNFAVDSDSIIGVDADSLTISSAIYHDGGSYGITKVGAGTLTLSGANIYTGTTTISAGTLALAPGINYFKVTGDGDSGISTDNTYTHAINPDGGSVAVNGVPFAGAGAGTLAAGSLATESYGAVTIENSIGSSHFGDVPIGTNLGGWSEVVGSLLDLFSHFDYGGQPARTILLTGLAPDTWYDVRLYEKQWDTSNGRSFSVSYDVGNDGSVEYTSPTIDQNHPEGNATLSALGVTQQNAWVQSYIYKTGPGQSSISLTINNSGAGSYHFYGISNQLVTPANLPTNLPPNLSPSSALSIAAGATLDVSGFLNYTLGSASSLTAAGTGTTPGTDAALIQGNAAGTVSLGAQPVSLVWGGASAGGESSHPALLVSQGTLTLGGNTITVVVPGTALGEGVYSLVATSSAISGTVNPTPVFAGSGVASGLTGVISISGNDVILTVSTSGGGGYAAWAHDYAGDGAPSDDYNNDGVANGVAYFMGATGIATNPGVVAGTVTWPYLNAVTSFEVQVSDNLADWAAANPSDVATTPPPGGQVSITLPSGPGITRKFCRLMVVP